MTMTEDAHAAVVTEKDVDRIISHIFLQTLMKRSCIPMEEAQEILDSLGEAAVGRDLSEVLASVTIDIAPLGFELKRIKYVDGVQYVGFVNKEADEISKKATNYKLKDGKPNVLYAAFFKSLLDGMCSNEDVSDSLGYITEQDAFYIPVMMSKEGEAGDGTQEVTEATMSLSERKKALDAFVADSWIAPHPREDSVYCFGPRTVLELGSMLLKRELPPNIKRSLMSAMGL